MKETFEDFYYSVKYRGNEIFDFIFKDLPQIIKNFWTFRKVISDYRWYGGHYSIFPILEVAIADMATHVKKEGIEIDETRLKKVAKRLGFKRKNAYLYISRKGKAQDAFYKLNHERDDERI